MRRILQLCLFLLLIAVVTPARAIEKSNVKALSFNIRYGTANDGDDSWPNRSEMVADMIRSCSADFCGLQEALRFQIDVIRKTLPVYAEHGCGRDDGKTKGEYSSILFRKDRWTLKHGETEWFSDTPKTPGSASWGNQIPRIVTWGQFKDKQSGLSLFVFNTHFDHKSQPSRVKSAKFLNRLIAEKAKGAPVIVMGDLNAGEQNPAIKTLKGQGDAKAVQLVDTFRVLHPSADGVGTFNGFRGQTNGEKIDYVFSRPTTRVKSATILRTNIDGRYPSDHFPVSAELVIEVK